jgi:LmbE family N-acetylglucosaminyl deacetylase
MDRHNNILILSPHTDDAELGCGGSISKFLEEGHRVYWVVFSTAENSLPENLPPDTLVKEFKNVVNHIKLKEDAFTVFRFPVRRLSEYRQEVLENLIKIKKQFNPELVIGPSLNDLHQDHIVVANEMIRAFKSSSSILSYELPWNHISFNTQFFVKLNESQINQKIDLLRFYKSQFAIKRFYFSEDFIKGLAMTRGAQINNQYAEAFEVIRWII